MFPDSPAPGLPSRLLIFRLFPLHLPLFLPGTPFALPPGMLRPGTSVEAIAPGRFRPPFCPRSECPSRRKGGAPFRYSRAGSYRRMCDRRVIPRFTCKVCGSGFSQQAFALTYYLKRPELLQPIAAGLVACSAHRQIARTLGCSHATVNLQSHRLGRHALLFQAVALGQIQTIREPVVADHFESFAYSQEMQLGIATPVGAESWFVYDLDPVPHKLGGPRSEAREKRLKKQKKRWGELPQGSYRQSARRCLDRLLKKTPKQQILEWITDGHPSYIRAIETHPERSRIRHGCYPNPERGPKGSPKSREAKVRDRKMFPVDLLHKLFRHSLANHKRETLAFGRRSNMVLLRCFHTIVWRNFVKDRSERSPTGRTPAIDLGLTDRKWKWREVLARRLFPFRIPVPEAWMRLYRQEMETPGVGRNLRHTLKYAF